MSIIIHPVELYFNTTERIKSFIIKCPRDCKIELPVYLFEKYIKATVENRVIDMIRDFKRISFIIVKPAPSPWIKTPGHNVSYFNHKR